MLRKRKWETSNSEKQDKPKPISKSKSSGNQGSKTDSASTQKKVQLLTTKEQSNKTLRNIIFRKLSSQFEKFWN
ncbi:hypothetical protein HYD89_02390 [Mycoplasmopsis bovis]|nr:hypothetical protein [Mycoplasmopsis bovis]QQH36192.1 hypothetical protein HYD89_02390 [Mycoplasmopsis bovis]